MHSDRIKPRRAKLATGTAYDFDGKALSGLLAGLPPADFDALKGLSGTLELEHLMQMAFLGATAQDGSVWFAGECENFVEYSFVSSHRLP